MSTNPLLIGIDVGTTNTKAVIFTRQGQTVAHAQAKTPTHYPEPEQAYYAPQELWETVIEVLQYAVSQVKRADDIAAIATASIGETGFPIDAQGNVTYDQAIAWFDQRTRPQFERLLDIFDSDEIFSQTGLPLQPISGLCKMLWMREHAPDAFHKTETWLNTADFIAFKLSGISATDYSLASRTLALDLHKRQWADDILQRINLPRNLFAPLHESGTDLGAIHPDIAATIGLPQHTRICVGGHDHICGALAVGATEPGTLLNSLGTAEALFFPIIKPLTDPLVGRQNFTIGAHVVPDRDYFLGGLLTSSASIEWFRMLLGDDADYATLISEAEQVPPGSGGVAFAPHLRFSNPPYGDTIARGAFIGLTPAASRCTLFRAILEGLALEARVIVDAAQSHSGVPKIDEIIAIGGGTRNRLLMQIKATVFNHPISIAQVDEAVALGAAVLAGIGSGVYADIPSAQEMLTLDTRTIKPMTAQVRNYDRLYEQIHRHVFPTLHDLHTEIDQFQHPNR